MTDQQPHTPTTDSVRRAFIDYEAWGQQQMRLRGEAFDRWYEAEIAAAEQRGAIKALRGAAQVMQEDLAWANTQRGLLVFEHESDPGISPFQWLRSRADQMEGDDD